jgi:hypothetical protein
MYERIAPSNRKDHTRRINPQSWWKPPSCTRKPVRQSAEGACRECRYGVFASSTHLSRTHLARARANRRRSAETAHFCILSTAAKATMERGEQTYADEGNRHAKPACIHRGLRSRSCPNQVMLSVYALSSHWRRSVRCPRFPANIRDFPSAR